MAQRRHHYERAFESYIRARRIPYVAVDEAKKALLPTGATPARAVDGSPARLKSFDFILYSEGVNVLCEVKGRTLGKAGVPVTARRRTHGPRFENWVTREDVESLGAWQALFGSGYAAAFVFVYWCAEQPRDSLFQEVMEFEGSWYALRAIEVGCYRAAMRPRSHRWGTVDLARETFERLSQPFAGPNEFAGGTALWDDLRRRDGGVPVVGGICAAPLLPLGGSVE
ncbi:MAG: HYExAFE family protein [Phycisphaerae bacterium]|nr:HYExAFE family protein [Phycisphaerae bacterium]